MPGYNHYPWCTCGWCVKYGMSRGRASELNASFDRYSARRFLEQHGALRSLTACFLNPNAQCPVCGASVFYYQNAHGSRVYFDELGPPWPKHPCTSKNPVYQRSQQQAFVPPVRRPRGLMLELIDATRKVFGGSPQVAYQESESDEWTLIEAMEVNRTGWQNNVLADFLGSTDRRWVKFIFDSANPMISVGDIFGMRDSEISLFDSEKMKPKTYKIRITESNLSSNEEK